MEGFSAEFGFEEERREGEGGLPSVPVIVALFGREAVGDFLPERVPVGIKALGEGILDGLAPVKEGLTGGSFGEGLSQRLQNISEGFQRFAFGIGEAGGGLREPFDFLGNGFEESLEV